MDKSALTMVHEFDKVPPDFEVMIPRGAGVPAAFKATLNKQPFTLTAGEWLAVPPDSELRVLHEDGVCYGLFRRWSKR